MALGTPPPPAKGMNAQQYYITLVRQGYPNAAAMAEVQNRYGPPMSQKEREAKQKEGGTAGTIAAGAGMIGGAIAARYAMDNAGKWYDKLTGKEVPAEVAKQTGAQAGQQMAESGTVSLTRPVPPEVTTVDGSGATVDLSGKTTTINTPSGPKEIPIEVQNDPGFLEGVDWGKVGQGAAGALQLYSAYKAYKGGDKVGAGISGASGAANIAAATGAMNTAAGSTGATVVPGLNALAGGYSAYQTAKATGSMAAGKQRDVAASLGGLGAGAGLGGAAAGMMYGAAAGPMGMLIGAGVGLAAGYLGSKFGSHKGKAQMVRDAIRGTMKDQGILDNNYQGTLADGTKYDFGKDGKTLKWSEIDKVAADNPNAWSSAVQLSDAMGTAYGFVGQKASDISAWYAKAAVSNAQDNPEKAKQNMRHFAQQQGITYDMIKGNLDSALADNRISQNQYNSYLSGAADLTGGTSNPPASIAKPAKGQVIRVSPGMYMNDRGQVSKASSIRQSLENNYGKKEKK